MSPLFVPGDRSDRFEKAATCGTDAVILDLEDAVAPEAKSLARSNISQRNPLSCRVLVRINAANSPWFADDLAALKLNPPDAVMLSKAERQVDLEHIRTVLGPDVQLIPLIESVRGLADIQDILKVPGLGAPVFGSLDFALDLGCDHEWDALLTARSELVLRSRLAGVAAPIDGVSVGLEDVGQIEIDARRARSLGFGGKLAIHPKQVAPIRAAFRYGPEETAWAEKVMAALDGDGAQRLDGKMIDRPVIERARRILERRS